MKSAEGSRGLNCNMGLYLVEWYIFTSLLLCTSRWWGCFMADTTNSFVIISAV